MHIKCMYDSNHTQHAEKAKLETVVDFRLFVLSINVLFQSIFLHVFSLLHLSLQTAESQFDGWNSSSHLEPGRLYHDTTA